jgi:spore germination protein KC
MNRKKVISLILVVLNMIALSGCWDLREINEIGFVTAAGIDKGKGTNKYIITVEIANPSQSGGNSGGDSSSMSNVVWIGTAKGDSLFDATRKLANISSRRIIWAHNNVIVIGQSLAKEGIIPVVDYFTHNHELRMKTAVVVANSDAKKYISSNIGMDKPSGMSYSVMERHRGLSGESVESDMLSVSAEIRNRYGNPLISRIRLKSSVIQSKDTSSGKNVKTGLTLKTVALGGAAVFKRDKMLGWLSNKQALGVAWILNQTINTEVTVLDSQHGNKSVSVQTEGVKTKIKTKIVGGIPRMAIYISGRGQIVEEDGFTNKSIDEVKRHVEKLIDKKIKNEVKDSLKVVQKKYKVDCLGFSDIVHTQNASEWRSGLKDNWQKLFPNVPISISVEIDINSSTLNEEPSRVY